MSMSLMGWLTLLSCLVAGACTEATRVAQEISPENLHLKVMTYNVNYGLSGNPEIISIIRNSRADVVFLQETTPQWESALRQELLDVFPNIEFRHWPGAGGLGILSRYPFDHVQYIKPPDGGWFPAWRVILHTPLGQVQALNVHLRPQMSDSGSVLSGYFTTPGIRLREIKHHLTHLDISLPTLIVGDFNENGNGTAMRHLSDRGLTSALNEFHPAAPTWRWQLSIGTIRSQLDHIVHDEKLLPLNAWVVEEGNSDHLPVVGVFERAED